MCKVWLTPAARVPCSNAANIGERKSSTESEFCTGQNSEFYTGQNSVRSKSPRKCIYSVPAQETAKHRAKFGWPPVSDVAAVTNPMTRNPLKFAGVPQTRQQDSAVSGPKFAILRRHLEEILLFNKSFSDCRYMPQLRRYSPTKLSDSA